MDQCQVCRAGEGQHVIGCLIGRIQAEHRATERVLLRRIYDTERQLPNRNFAKDHSFEEWLEHC